MRLVTYAQIARMTARRGVGAGAGGRAWEGVQQKTGRSCARGQGAQAAAQDGGAAGPHLLRGLQRAGVSALFDEPRVVCDCVHAVVRVGDRMFFVDISPVVAYQKLSCKFQESFRWATTGK